MSSARLFAPIRFFLLGFLMIMPHATPAGAAPANTPASGVLGWIELVPTNDGNGQGYMLSITGRAAALEPVNARYALEVKRESRGGTSNTRQGGAVMLAPGKTAVLSQSTINVGPADGITIELKLYVGEDEVFSASIRSVAGQISRQL